MRDIRQELREEADELRIKLSKLKGFLEIGRPDYITNDHWELLKNQKNAMQQYYNILVLRIDNLKFD